jgi:tetratricopeptide (TPR) repeat protein
MNDPVIEAYLERARQALAASEELVDSDSLRAIALEVGMTASLSEQADRQAVELTERGRERLEADGRDEAIGLLEDAILLGPTRLQGHLLLARAYGQRWESARHEPQGRAARKKAIALCHRCLELAPHHPQAEALLKALGLQPAKDALSWKHAALIVFILVGISGSMSLCVRYALIPESRNDSAGEEQASPASTTPSSSPRDDL